MDKMPPARDPKDVVDNKDLAALGYVWILSLVVLFAKRGSPFVQFHARQGAVLFVLSLVVWAIPYVGKLTEVLVLALCIIGFLHAAQGEWREVPIVGPLSRGSIGDLRNSWKDVVAAVTSLWSRVRGTDATASKTPAEPVQTPPAPVIDVAFADVPTAPAAPSSESPIISETPDSVGTPPPAEPYSDVPPSFPS